MRPGILTALVVIVAACGCGGERDQERRAATARPAAAKTVSTQARPARCAAAGRVRGRRLTLCQGRPNSGSPGTFRVGGQRLAVKHPFGRGGDGHFHGGWSWAAAAPDGRTILAQFHGECEIPMAFFIPARGGRPRAVTGRYSRDRPPDTSIALGWTTGGRAVAFLPSDPACGGAGRSGVFLVSPQGGREKIAGVRPGERPRPRLRPWDRESVRRAFAR